MNTKHIVLAIVMAVAGYIVPAAAQDVKPLFDKGPVWTFTEIKTKEGHFDDYMKFLATDFKHQSDVLKQEGRLIDYKLFIVNEPRATEGNIWIAREYPNMAAFDHTSEEDYALEAKIAGSIAHANQQQAARGSIRDLLNQVMVREITLK